MAAWTTEKKDPGSFDSRIDPPGKSPHFELTLTLRLRFVPANPPGGKASALVADFDGNRVPVLRWNRAEWIGFRTEFRIQVHTTWDHAFLLTPPGSFDGFVWPERRGTRRRVLCGLRVLVQDEPSEDVHATITLVRLAHPRRHSFRSDSFTLDSGAVLPKKSGRFGASWTRVTAVHEIGHLLGLGHVNQRSPECRQAPGSLICYGANLPQAVNVMGHGGVLDHGNAKPWTERIAWHTKTRPEEWTVDWASDEASLRGTESIVTK